MFEADSREDSAVTRRLYVAVCREAGHEVIEAADGRQACDAFEAEQCPLLVLDWSMPVMDGLAVCRRVRELQPTGEAFILMVTGKSTPSDVNEALNAGADDFISKPVMAEHLAARLQIAEKRILQNEHQRRSHATLARARWLADSLRDCAHALQGSAGSVTGYLVSEIAEELELLGRNGLAASARPTFARLVSEVAILQKALDQFTRQGS
ncbi:MAG TPA: response regulator [Gemmatimonadaceae bacterium]|nr:response regulator [Gemmatimonadaceae bacterium]